MRKENKCLAYHLRRPAALRDVSAWQVKGRDSNVAWLSSNVFAASSFALGSHKFNEP